MIQTFKIKSPKQSPRLITTITIVTLLITHITLIALISISWTAHNPKVVGSNPAPATIYKTP